MATQWPLLASRLVALLPTLSGWSAVSVFDGPPVTGDTPTSYCTVGFIEDEDAGGYTDDQATAGNTLTTESGAIRCRLVVVSGDTDLSALRTAAFALVDALRASLRSDPTAGVLPAGSMTSLEVNVRSAQNDRGAGQALDFVVSYSCPVF